MVPESVWVIQGITVRRLEVGKTSDADPDPLTESSSEPTLDRYRLGKRLKMLDGILRILIIGKL